MGDEVLNIAVRSEEDDTKMAVKTFSLLRRKQADTVVKITLNKRLRDE